MKQFKGSMRRKQESLSKKNEDTTDVISVKLEELKGVTDADKVLADLKELGFDTIDYGDYASKDKAYAVLKHPNGMYVDLDYTWERDASGRDSYNPGEVLEYEYFKDKAEYEDIHGYSPRESKQPESKKNEDISSRIQMGIDCNMFKRMCSSAAYLTEDENYWDALWDYYSEGGPIKDALVFFDNLFQYTEWCDVDELYEEYLDDKFKDESKSRVECIQAAIDDGDLDAYKHESGNYLVIL